MNYVEWLRVRNAVKWTGIVLVALLVVLVIVRISIRGQMADPMAYVHTVEGRKTTQVTHSVLPDGTNRTSILDASDGTRVVVDDSGYQGKRITIVQRSSHSGTHAPTSVGIGSVGVQSIDHGKVDVTTIRTDLPEGFENYAGLAALVALLIATVLGAPFARENDGHLEIALTKPIAREPLALGTMGADLVGIAAAWIMTVVFLVLAHAMFQAPHIVFGSDAVSMTAIALIGSAAWYAMLCAATASMKRSYGAVLGLAWPISLLVTLLGKIELGPTPLAGVVHAIFAPLSTIVPLAYFHFGVSSAPGSGDSPLAVPILVVLAVAYGAFAIAQWRRVEA